MQPLNKFVTAAILVNGLFISLSASAEFIATEKNAEANQVSIIFTKEMEQGIAQAQECTGCPLNLNFDAQTRFFQNGKEIERNRIRSLSGKPATVIYSKDGKQALRIFW